MYYLEDQVARAAAEVGIRAIAGETVIQYPAPDAKEPYGGLDYAKKFIEAFRGHELITPALAPHAPYSVGEEQLALVAEWAEKLDVPVLIHSRRRRKRSSRSGAISVRRRSSTSIRWAY
jgi:cytosine/adenosine deaminase-related metal-dependent hydrolase